MIDTWPDLTFDFCIDWLYFSLFMFYMLYLSYSSTVYHYVHMFICTSTFFFLTHSLGRFLTTLDLHVKVLDVSCYWLGVRLRPGMLRGARVFLYPLWYYCLSFHSYWFCSFPDPLYFVISYYSIPYSYVICLDAYMWYCSDHDSF